MAAKRHLLLKCSFWISGGLIFLLLIIVVSAKFWIIPEFAEKKIASVLEQMWDGTSVVKKVEFNYFKPSVVHQISLTDKKNRLWLWIDTVEVKIADLLRFSPKIQEIEVSKLIINAYVTDNTLSVPLKRQQNKKKTANKLDIAKFVINEAVINIEKNERSTITYILNLIAERQEDFYDIKLTQLTSIPEQMFVLAGRINPTNLQVDLNIDANQEFKIDQTDLLLAMLKIPDVYKTEGRLMVKLDLSGKLNQPASLQPVGTANLSGWNVLSTGKVLASDLGALIKCRQNYLDIENLQANLCDGLVEGVFFVEDIRTMPVRINAELSGEKIDLAQLSAAVGREKKVSKGTGSFSSNFTITAGDINSLQGQCLVILNDTGLGVFPVMSKIFEFIGLGGGKAKNSADIVAEFAVAGPVLTIEKGRVASPAGAINAEPGGTINIQTGQLDFYVVAMSFEQVEKAIKKVPVAGHIVNFKDKLTRLHIKGHQSEPPAKLITKEPLTDIKDATIGFIRNVIDNEGQIPQETFDKFKNLFKAESKSK